ALNGNMIVADIAVEDITRSGAHRALLARGFTLAWNARGQQLLHPALIQVGQLLELRRLLGCCHRSFLPCVRRAVRAQRWALQWANCRAIQSSTESSRTSDLTAGESPMVDAQVSARWSRALLIRIFSSRCFS